MSTGATATAVESEHEPPGLPSDDDTPIVERGVWRKLAPFLVVWIALPAALRVVMLTAWLTSAHQDWPLFRFLLGVTLGVCQDLFIAFQALLVMRAARWITRGLPLIWLGIGYVIFVALTIYQLVDFLLFLGIDLRMTASFWHFFLDAEVFLDSVEEIGLRYIIGGTAFVIVGAMLVFWYLASAFREIELTRRVGLSALGISTIGVLGALYGPGELMYIANNVAVADQIETVRNLLGVEDALVRHARQHDGDELVTPRPAAEDYTLLAPDRAPLLRQTHGFEGPTHFDVRVDANEAPHVVLLVLESFRARDIGVYGGAYDVTPNFDRLSHEGVLFTDFYAVGVQTTRAVVSLLFGVMPRFSQDAVQATDPDIDLIGLHDILADRGYHTAYLHNGELDFEGMGAFFESQGFDTIVGQRDLEEIYPDAERFSWGLHDEYLVDFAVDWLARTHATGQPTFTTIFTISNHHPWTLPSDWEPAYVPVSPEETYGRFLRALHYTDHALGVFVKRLRDRGLADDTIVLVTADTSQAMGDRHENFAVSRNLFYENIRVPLLILADGRLDRRPRLVEEPGSQADVLPTVLDMLGIAATHHSSGRSLRRRAPDRPVYFQSPFALGYWGVRQGPYKYFYVMRADRHHLYDVEADPGETQNLADQKPRLRDELHLSVARMHRLFRTLYRDRRFR